MSQPLTRPVAQFDGLALDVAEPDRAAAFWRVALGGKVISDGAGSLRVAPGWDRPPREKLRLRATEAPTRDDARVHVDVRLADARPDHLLAAGARVVRPPGGDPWYVLSDPEGNEFCAFPAKGDRPAGMFELVVKCTDAHGLARWWAAVLGGRAAEEGEAAVVVGAPEFPWDYMVFDPVPGIERYRARLRWHLTVSDVRRDLAALRDLGATTRAEPDGDGGGWVLADPEGNEFCVTPAG